MRRLIGMCVLASALVPTFARAQASPPPKTPPPPQQAAPASEEELRTFCRGELAPYKVPAHVEFRAELPKTMVGKVLRRALRDGG